MSNQHNPYDRDPTHRDHGRAKDLGPAGFDPNAPYTPIDPLPVSSSPFSFDNQEKNLALLAHLTGCLGIVVGSVPGFLGPLIIWLWQKDQSPFVEEQAKEALNFQITLLIVGVVCIALVFVSCGTLFPIVFVPMVLQVVFGIIAVLSVSGGNAYRYPFNLRLIK